MKKIFIALSIVILAACSDNNIGGYTDSIVKNANDSQGSSKPQKTLSLAKSATPLEDDLSSLDEDALREKLMNTDPRPMMLKASSVEYFEIIHETYDDKIEDYSWEETRPNITKSEHHKYGFDRDPTERDNVVYMSVETGTESKTKGIAYFDAHLSTEAFSQYRLQLNDGNKTRIPLTLDKDGNAKDVEIADEGTYELEGCSKTFGFICDIPAIGNLAWTYLGKNIVLKAYPPETKIIVYAQIDGDGWETDEKECNKGFNKKCVKEYFEDSVFNQAVLKVDLKAAEDIDKNFPIKNDYHIAIDMNNPDDNIQDYLIQEALKLTKFNTSGKNYRHFVYAINREKKFWNLRDCNMEYKNLSKCNSFSPEEELESAKYYMISDFKDSRCFKNGKNLGGIGKKEKEVIFKTDAFGNLFAFDKKGSGETPLNYNNCDILYTTEGYPVHPSIKGVNGGRAAASDPLGYTLHQDYLPKGSTIITPRAVGTTGLYALMHEIGHSFGLTDVSSSNLFVNPSSKSSYASSETNLMSWQRPIGKKLRYRNTTTTACSGGKKFYIGDENTYFDATEYTIELTPVKEKGDIIDWQNGEKQWDCVRNCFASEFKTKARVSFFGHKNDCEDDKVKGNEPEDFKDKYIKACKKDQKNQIDRFLDLKNASYKPKDTDKEEWISSFCDKMFKAISSRIKEE